MDHHQQQLFHDHDAQAAYNGYTMYSDEDTSYGLVHANMSYPGVVPSTRQLSNEEIQAQAQAMQYQRSMMIQQHAPFPAAAPVQGMFGEAPHGGLPPSHSPPPQSPGGLYDPLSPPISGSETSGEGPYHTHSRNSSSAGSPSSSRANSLVHRQPLRYANPTPSPTSSSTGRRSRGRSISDDEDGMGAGTAEQLANTRKEATRKQRIEAEQRRRDELREGYARLKDVLPVSNQKSSKVALLERARNHIMSLEKSVKELNDKLAEADAEVARLRLINEKISLAGTPAATNDPRPISPPADAPKLSQNPQPPTQTPSPAASESGY